MQSAARGRRGLTLIELLLVLGILSTILGLSLGMFAALDPAKRQAVGLVRNTLRAAQNSAISRRAPAAVRLDPKRNVLSPRFQEVVGTWHFESAELPGAFGIQGRLIDAEITPDGYIGSALDCAVDAEGPRAELPIQRDPSSDFRAGFALECAARRATAEAGEIANAGGSFGLQVLRDGAVRGWFAPEAQSQDGGVARGGHVLVESEPGALPIGEWRRVRLEYAQQELALSVDGVVVARVDDEAPLWRLEGALMISSARTPFRGQIDAVVVTAVTASADVALPEGVSFAPEMALAVRFQSGGGLDRRAHALPVRIALDFADGAREWVTVGLYGTVE
jgi:prepilin-type N-terminal cleavage/methylation domain-containing protein